MAPMTNAERQKKYRERLKNDPVKYEALRKKHLDRVKSNKKKIDYLSDTQKEETRKKWREYSARYYRKKKGELRADKEEDTSKTKSQENTNTKKIKAKVKKLTKEVKATKEALIVTMKRNENMKKQIYRLKQKVAAIKNNKEKYTKEDIAQTNNELEILSESLKSVYKLSNRQEKNVLKKVIVNPITKKHRITNKLTKVIGLKGKIRKYVVMSSKRCSLKKEIHDFYLRDDVSRPTAGKKECKTKNKIKIQIRYLLDTVKHLYELYKTNGGKASYNTVLRHKPFYVLPPKLENCETCACMRHENIKFKITKLYKLGVIETCYQNDLLKQIACDLESKACMYGECQNCASKNIDIVQMDPTENISWLEWGLKKVSYKKKNDEGQPIESFTKKVTKEVKTENSRVFVHKFQNEIKLFKRHVFNMNHQQNKFREATKNIKVNEVVLIIDFSENYQCKHNVEIQGMHFGSSRKQITLHTGVAYIKNRKPEPFCTISPNNEHSPFSIWAHLYPVINYFKYSYPDIDTIHMFSDGPTTQYRQKINFALFSKYTKYFGFNHASWSFFEASHGKNAADGIGGVLKRLLDRYVAYGADISDANAAFKLLQDKSSITLYYITDHDIAIIKEFNPMNHISQLTGTMMLHQIISTEDVNKIKYRHISCFCGERRGDCLCFDVKVHKLVKDKNMSDTKQKREIVIKTGTEVKKRKLNGPSEAKGKENQLKINKRIKRKTHENSMERQQDINMESENKTKEEKSILIQAAPKRKVNKSKQCKGKKKKKQTIDYSSSNTDLDSNLYAKSDDSPWNEGESDDDLFIVNRNKMARPIKNKVTILSEVKYSAENCNYLDVTKAGPLKLNKIDLNYNLHTKKYIDNTSDEESIF